MASWIVVPASNFHSSELNIKTLNVLDPTDVDLVSNPAKAPAVIYGGAIVNKTLAVGGDTHTTNVIASSNVTAQNVISNTASASTIVMNMGDASTPLTIQNRSFTSGGYPLTFEKILLSNTAITDSNQASSKAYVDQVAAYGIKWNAPVIGFHDFTSLPVSPNIGDRYIALTTTGAFTENNIYTWSAPTPSWVETVVAEGMAVCVMSDTDPLFPNRVIVYIVNAGVGAWQSISGPITYDSLVGKPDQAIGALNQAGSPQFSSLYLSSTQTADVAGVGGVYDTTVGAFRTAGGASIQQDCLIMGTARVHGGLNVDNATILYGPLTVNADAYIQRITGSNSITANALTINGASTFQSGSFSQAVALAAALTSSYTMDNNGSLGNGSFAFSGGGSIAMKLALGGLLYSLNTTDSTAIMNGAAMFSGGVGVIKSINAGGAINSLTSMSAPTATISGALSANSSSVATSHTCATLHVTGTSALDGNVTAGANATVAGTTTTATLNVTGASTQTGNASFGGAGTFTGPIATNNTTDALAGNDGAAIIKGGMSVFKSLITGGPITSNSTVAIKDATASSSPTTGSFTTVGGAGIGGNLNTAGTIASTNTTNSTSVSTGAFTSPGGAGFGGNVTVGGTLTAWSAQVSANAIFLRNVTVAGNTSGPLNIPFGTTWQSAYTTDTILVTTATGVTGVTMPQANVNLTVGWRVKILNFSLVPTTIYRYDSVILGVVQPNASAKVYCSDISTNAGTWYVEGAASYAITGMVSTFFSNTAPSGWLVADGSNVTKANYPNLWTMLSSVTTNLTATTITISNPAVVTCPNHGLGGGDAFQFTATTGALPTGLSLNTWYYVLSTALTAGTFHLSTSYEGTAIATSGSTSGTATITFSAVWSDSLTFNLPDLRGKFVRGAAGSGAIDQYRVLGGNQWDDFKSHTHIGYVGGGPTGGGAPSPGTSVFATQTTQATGGTETRPRNVALLTCIKY